MKRLSILALLAALLLCGAVSAKGNGVYRFGDVGLPRAVHTATSLAGQMIFIAGGMQEDGVSTATTLFYDNLRDSFRAGPDMTVARAGHTATQLNDRRILMLGGWDDRRAVSTAEVYIPRENKFVSLGDAPVSGGGFTSTRLLDGHVLIVGGDEQSVSLFNPETNTFREAQPLNVPRASHTATLLDDGRVLIAGGFDGNDVVASAEVYDPESGAFTLVGSLAEARYKHAAVKLADGRVLVMGGSTQDDWDARLASAEIFDPLTGEFAPAASMRWARFKFADAAILLKDGRVLVAGGGQPEIYDPELDEFVLVDTELSRALHFSTASILHTGMVVIVGGYDQEIDVSSTAYFYLPAHGTEADLEFAPLDVSFGG